MGYQNNERPEEPHLLIADINYDLSDLIDELESLVRYAPDGINSTLKRMMRNIHYIKDSVWKLDRKMFPTEV
jgi:hypothetical protein